MPWYVYMAHFFGGVFLINAVPHLASGLRGQAFRTPFVGLHGGNTSSPIMNVVWGWLNALAGVLLLGYVGPARIADMADLASIALGALLTGVLLAWYFSTRPSIGD